MDDSDAALPKATVLKLVRESLPPDIRISADAQDVLVECATEFVKLLGTQANEVSIMDDITPCASSLMHRTRCGFCMHEHYGVFFGNFLVICKRQQIDKIYARLITVDSYVLRFTGGNPNGADSFVAAPRGLGQPG